MSYSPREADFLQIVECADGRYRTAEMKTQFDAGNLKEVWCGLRHVWIEMEKDAV